MHFKSPTNGQAVCGLNASYTDTPLGCFLRINKWLNMKTKLFILIFIISSFKIFASNSLEVTYKTDNIRINYFLGYQEEIFLPDISENEKYKNIEKNFYDFIYFTDTLIEISNRIDANIYFYSEHDLSELTIGEKKYLFVSQRRLSEIQTSKKDYTLTEDYTNPDFIISFICKELKLQIPEKKIKNRKLYSLEIKSIQEIDFSEDNDTDIIFFYPGGEIYYSPLFEIDKKIYIGFYYSFKDAKNMRRILKDKYNQRSIIKEFPLDFNLINKAYFKISYDDRQFLEGRQP